MSRFFSAKYQNLLPYTPGEQPQERKYIKLNTNESPFPPSPKAVKAAAQAAQTLQLYSDPESRLLSQKIADTFGVEREEVLVTNGSDDVLNFAFMAFCDREHPAVFPDITYGFYPVFADLNAVPYDTIALCEDFSVNVSDYIGVQKTVFLANPNAPTGIALPVSEIEQIIRSNPDNVVVIDEAYVDFGAHSCISLVHKYENLLVVGTFSKSRSMAGARLGFCIGCKALIRDLNTIKYSTNPYNVNRMTSAAGIGALEDEKYTRDNCRTIIENRAYATEQLEKLGFVLTPSKSNFLFARHSQISGSDLYQKLKARGILVRHFDKQRIVDYVRITVGTRQQMQALIDAIKEILEEWK